MTPEQLAHRRLKQAESQRRLRLSRRGELPPGTCDLCGVTFKRLKPNKRFCSEQCRKKSHYLKKAGE